MTKKLFVVVFLLALAVPALSQTGTSLQGVWRITESFRAPGEGAQKTATMQPQPGYYIFTPRHYSVTRVVGDKPRIPPQDPAKATVAELQEADRFGAQFGTYEIKGDSITFTASVLHSAAAMAATNTPTPWHFKIDGKSLTLTGKTAEGAPRRIVMTRVE